MHAAIPYTGRRRWLPPLLAIVFIIIWIFPIYWMFITATGTRETQFSLQPSLIPKSLSWHNFRTAVVSDSFSIYLRNSLIVTVTAVLVAIVMAFLACAAFTFDRFRAKGTMMGVVMMLQMIPGIALLIPQFIVFNRFGLLDTYIGLILAYVASVLPVAIWNMHGFFLTMPPTLFESARVDGASEWQILMRITFPIVLPGIISTSVLAFIHSWNDYLFAYTFMKDPSKYTLPVWLASFATPTGIDVGAQMAASLLFSLPVIVFFMLVQRGLLKGSVEGAVK